MVINDCLSAGDIKAPGTQPPLSGLGRAGVLQNMYVMEDRSGKTAA